MHYDIIEVSQIMPNMPILKLIKRLPKIISIFTLFIFIGLILSACSLLPFSKNSAPVTLEYWGLWESPTVMDTIINDYKQIKPNVTITYKKRSPQQYRETLESQINSGKGPDIFRFHNTWIPMLKEELDSVPSDIISRTEFSNNYYPIVSQLQSNGKYVGIPLEYDGLGLFYNEEIFRAAGIAAPPTTWEQFNQIAARLTVKDTVGNIKTAGAAIGTAGNVDHFSDILGMMIIQNGGDPKSPTDKQASDALEYYTHFANGQNRVWDETMPSSTVAFAGGNLAMYFGPSWRAIEFKNANPLLKFKVAPVPQLEGGKVTWASYWAEGVSAQSQHKQEAWEFLKFLQQDENLIKLYAESAKSPGRFFGEPYPKVSLAQKLSADPVLGSFVSDAQFARTFPMASLTYDNGLNDQIIKAYEDAVNSVNNGGFASNALEVTSNNIKNILTRFGANP